jgi:hypothetical protein
MKTVLHGSSSLNDVQAVWQLVGRTIRRSVHCKYRATAFDCRDEARRHLTVAYVLNQSIDRGLPFRLMHLLSSSVVRNNPLA